MIGVQVLVRLQRVKVSKNPCVLFDVVNVMTGYQGYLLEGYVHVIEARQTQQMPCGSQVYFPAKHAKPLALLIWSRQLRHVSQEFGMSYSSVRCYSSKSKVWQSILT